MSLCLYRTSQNEYMDGEHNTPMLESFLTFLSILVNVRTNLGKFFCHFKKFFINKSWNLHITNMVLF